LIAELTNATEQHNPLKSLCEDPQQQLDDSQAHSQDDFQKSEAMITDLKSQLSGRKSTKKCFK
jgi:hypothetical protein